MISIDARSFVLRGSGFHLLLRFMSADIFQPYNVVFAQNILKYDIWACHQSETIFFA